MYIAITVLHIIACLFLIGVVLLQQGKGADMGAVFGGSSQTIFGSGGAGNFLTRLTAAAAVTFMLTSLTLAYSSARNVTATVFDDAPIPVSAPAERGADGAPMPPAAGVQPEAAIVEDAIVEEAVVVEEAAPAADAAEADAGAADEATAEKPADQPPTAVD